MEWMQRDMSDFCARHVLLLSLLLDRLSFSVAIQIIFWDSVEQTSAAD